MCWVMDLTNVCWYWYIYHIPGRELIQSSGQVYSRKIRHTINLLAHISMENLLVIDRLDRVLGRFFKKKKKKKDSPHSLLAVSMITMQSKHF